MSIERNSSTRVIHIEYVNFSKKDIELYRPYEDYVLELNTYLERLIKREIMGIDGEVEYINKRNDEIKEMLDIFESARFENFESLIKIISEKLKEKISLATVYNTVHAFKQKGYLKEISINSDKSYFDTNTSVHHHFFDEDTNELIDCNENDIDSINVKRNVPGKKINSVEVLIKIASDNHNQN